MIYEVRDYHIRPDIYEAYKEWGEEAVPILRELFDVVGFWIEAGEAQPEIDGTHPIGAPIGEANAMRSGRVEGSLFRVVCYDKYSGTGTCD